jgi:hypothetical protein
MMPGGSLVDVSQERDPIFGRYAPLEDSRGTTLVKLSLDYHEGLGASLMRTSLRLIQPLHLQLYFLTFHNSKDLSQELVHAN